MVVHAYYPIGETRVEREARALINCGYEVDVICLGVNQGPSPDTLDGVNIYCINVERHQGGSLITQLFEYMVFFILATIKLIGLQKKRRYKVIQVHNLPDWLVFVCLIPKLMGARVILDLHDLMPEFFAARFKRDMSSLPVQLIVLQERVSCLFADHVITVTAAWKNTLIERGLPPSKVSVVMNVADDRVFFRSQRNEHPQRDSDHFRLLYHGNLSYRYGIDIAIRAVALVKNQIPNIQLHIHGWGDYKQNLVELTEELGLNDYVSFSSQNLLTSELPALIQQAHLCLVPYRVDIFTDGILPTKLMEYAALGIPVIAAHTSTISSYFDSTMVQFFKPGDVQELASLLLELSSDHSRLEQLADGITTFNKRYSWSDISAQYVSLVEQIGQQKEKK